MVLNTLDGIDSKDAELLVIFTTNYPDKISKAMKRPGRLDCVATITPPDDLSVRKLIRIYGNKVLEDGINLSKVSSILVGQIPAVIREVVERAKLAAIPNLGPKEPMVITEANLLEAAESMIEHIEMLNQPKKYEMSDLEKAGLAVSALFLKGTKVLTDTYSGRTESDKVVKMLAE